MPQDKINVKNIHYIYFKYWQLRKEKITQSNNHKKEKYSIFTQKNAEPKNVWCTR